MLLNFYFDCDLPSMLLEQNPNQPIWFNWERVWFRTRVRLELILGVINALGLGLRVAWLFMDCLVHIQDTKKDTASCKQQFKSDRLCELGATVYLETFFF